jgi:hypothetical protein
VKFAKQTCIGGIVLAAAVSSPCHAQGIIAGNEFNPAISLILDGQYSSYSNDPGDYEISGFLLDEEAGLTAEGFSLDETELNISANVDDWFYGFADIVFEDDENETEVELEEAYFETLALPAGWTIKGGKFLSGVGYHNALHPHSWDFSDEPLAYRAMFGTAFTDVGAQVRWVAPTDLFIQLGAEAFRGASYPSSGSANDGTGAWSLFAKSGGDVGASNSWKAGVSYLGYEAEGWDTEFGDGDLSLDGDGDVLMAEFIWKWAPNGNPRERALTLQAEYLHREEDGDADFASDDLTEQSDYDFEQDGLYVQGVYRFRPGWRIGVRYDWLSADNDVPDLSAESPLDDDRDPERFTAMIDWSHTEFSRLRLQVAKDDSSSDSDTQVVLQYVLSLGPHGAHQF